MTRRLFTILALAICTSLGSAVFAQDIYDDLYDTPVKKNTKAVSVTQNSNNYRTVTTTMAQDPASMSVDEYNRRGFFSDLSDEVVDEDTVVADFNNTQNIERFYNANVIEDQNDPDLAYMYESSFYESPTTVNIYVNDYWPYSNYWGSPYYYTSWYSPWYSPWYSGWYSPWYSGWGWSVGWGWGPGWGWTTPGWGWGWAGPAWGGPKPHNPRHPGAWANNHSGWGYPNGGTLSSGGRPGGVRPGGGNPGVVVGNSGTRPSGINPSHPGGRPGVSSSTTRPGLNSSNNNMPTQTVRPTVDVKPSNGQLTRPGTIQGNTQNNGYRPGVTTTRPSTTTTVRPSSTITTRPSTTTTVRPSSTVTTRPSTTTTTRPSTTTTTRPSTTTTTRPSTTTTTRPSTTTTTRPSTPSYSRPSGGSFGGGSRGGFGGGSRGGAGGGRGGRH